MPDAVAQIKVAHRFPVLAGIIKKLTNRKMKKQPTLIVQGGLPQRGAHTH